MTDGQRVLEFMQKHGRITQADACTFGCYRLSARIHDLRHDHGYNIVTEYEDNKTKGGTHAVYRLAEEEPDGSI